MSSRDRFGDSSTPRGVHGPIPMWRRLIHTDDARSPTVLRVALGVVMFAHGAQSLVGWFGGAGPGATIEGFAQMGLPAMVAVLVMVTEFVGGLGLIVGLLTRLASVGIAVVMVGAVYHVHWSYGFFMNWYGQQAGEGFEYHVLAIAMALALVVHGGGWASADGVLVRRESRPVVTRTATLPNGMIAGWLVLSAVVFPPTALAQVALPPVNLSPDLLDGVAGPGVLLQQSIQWQDARRIRDEDGDALPGRNRISSVATLSHVAWLTRARLFGAHYGIEALLPAAGVWLRTAATPSSHDWNVGDLIVAPLILQWTGQQVGGRDLSHRFALTFTLPTGDYDRAGGVNIGSGHWSAEPYWAFTIVPASRWEVSARVMYLWNGSNRNPTAAGLVSVHPGQAFHANYATSYELRRGVRVGLLGYHLQQTTLHDIDGIGIADSRERVIGLGPGLLWTSGRTKLTVSGYIEVGARNRATGPKLVVRFAHVLPGSEIEN